METYPIKSERIYLQIYIKCRQFFTRLVNSNFDEKKQRNSTPRSKVKEVNEKYEAAEGETNRFTTCLIIRCMKKSFEDVGIKSVLKSYERLYTCENILEPYETVFINN